ncbi:MAG TPA: hypothetical protein VNF99_01080 [Stellaceae bacterium]|nr:hypothetical protein [Stellaceae bacterium]
MPALALLVPSWLDLAGWAGVILASLAMIGVGRLATGGRATPEAALIAGWGGCVLVLTAWGIATAASLRVPGLALMALGLVAQLWPRLRLGGRDWRALGRVAALALPLLAIMASARPSLPDTWLNLLPNAAYLYDHGFFPADARPPAYSFIAGAPYNMQLASLMAGLVLPNFPASAMIDFNLVLQLAAGLLLARLATGDDAAAPGWAIAALGILLATALNPGFDPRYHLSAYSEASVTVALAFAGWHAARALDRAGGGRDAQLDFRLLALTLAALVNIKQESVALALGVVVSACVLALLARARRREAALGIALATLPAVVLYLGWRWYVLEHFALGELKDLPFAQWHILELPQIILNMLRAAGGKILFFAILLAALAAASWRLLRRELDLATRLAAMLLGTAIVYNAALIAAYVAHFEGGMGIEAHSYFRYSTHLGLLLMAALVLLARDWRWSDFGGRWRRAVPAVLVLLILLVPLPFLRMLRFDLEPPNLRAFQLAHEAALRIGGATHLLLILPGDNGTVPPTLEGVLRYLPPRHPAIEFGVATDVAAGLAMPGYARALLSCVPPGFDTVPAGDAALLQRVGEAWQAEAIWPYDPPPAQARWSHVLALAPLCLTPTDTKARAPAG